MNIMKNIATRRRPSSYAKASRRSRQRRRLLGDQLEPRLLLAGPHAPAADVEGSTAIEARSVLIKNWASEVIDYSPGIEVNDQFQTSQNALGPSTPGEGGNPPDTVSLGRGGQITVGFENPIRDGFGDDFAVFENSFSDTFLELAYVEVSSNGTDFVRFESDSLTDAPVEAFGSVDPTNVDGLAGKYRGGFGTGFDLADLDASGIELDRSAITHVRIVDVVGDGNSFDTSGDPIYDPFPSTGSAGFDLDAVGVIHQSEVQRSKVDFEDVGSGLATQSFFNGPDPNGTTTTGPFDDTVVLGSFQSGEVGFNNNFSSTFGSWNGFAYSNVVDTTTAGFANQHASFAGSGASDSDTYGVGFVPSNAFYDKPTISLSDDDDRRFSSIDITNTTYAALSMLNGDMFAKKFGGVSGDDPDFLSLAITGLDADGNSIGNVVFFLADFRFDDNSLDYIVDEWTTVDLTSIQHARSIQFEISSSDVGSFGINTPTYFAADDVSLFKPVLPIEFSNPIVSEDAGTEATFLRVHRGDVAIDQTVEVSLEIDVVGSVTLPSTVSIPSGDAFVDVPVSVTDNETLADGRSVDISASVDGFADGVATLSIINDDFSLMVDILADSAAESSAPPIATAELLGRELGPESFFNGADESGQIVSDGLTFSNSFNPSFQSWSGWAVSNVTDNTVGGFANQYAALTGEGADGSDTYFVGNAFPGGFVPTIVRDPLASTAFDSIDITNTAYAAFSMLDGDAFAKQFGGDDGSDPDFFTLTIEGIDAADDSVGTIEVDLADFRFDDNTSDFILDSWLTVDLSPIAVATELRFSLASSDNGDFGMNTPAYFAADNVRTIGTGDSPMARITRDSIDLSQSLTVEVSSNDESEIRVPSAVVIPAGESFVDVDLGIAKDYLVDGDQDVVITASAGDFAGGSDNITVEDADVVVLTLNLPTSILEDAGTSTASVHRNVADVEDALPLTVTSGDTDLLTVAPDVSFEAGSRWSTFEFTPIDNEDLAGVVSADITALADGFPSVTESIEILDDDSLKPALRIVLDSMVISEANAATTIHFEDIGATIPVEGFDNGANRSGQFTAGPAVLNNSFNPAFSSWSGWSVSNVTDNTTAGFTNQYSAFTGGGDRGSETYAVSNAFPGGFVPTISLSDEQLGFDSIEVTNSTYAALSMRDGDMFAKQFGGESGDDPDFFLLTISGADADGNSVGTIDFYLADFRFDDNQLDYIVDEWTTVDVSSLVGATELSFALSSSDVGQFGMNTPAYFAVDNILLSDPTAPAAAMATITRSNTSLDESLDVALAVDDETEVVVPVSVTIPAGQASVTIPVRAFEDALVDADQLVSLSVTTEGFRPADAAVEIANADAGLLTLTPLGDLASNGSVPENADDNVSVLVHHNLESTDQAIRFDLTTISTDIDIPDFIQIDAGSQSTLLAVTTADNPTADGNREAGIQFAQVVPGDESGLIGGFSLNIIDDEVPAVVLDFVANDDGALEVQELLDAPEVAVALAAQPLGTVTIALTASNDQVRTNTTSLTFEPDNWDVPQVLVVSAVGDLQLEELQSESIQFSASDSDALALFEGVSETASVAVIDYQPVNLRLSQTEDSIVLQDTDVDQPLVSSPLTSGIQLATSSIDQSVEIESLAGSRGPIVISLGGGDDFVRLSGDRFTLLDGGLGADTLEIMLSQAIDLTSFLDQRVFGFEEIILNAPDGVEVVSEISVDQLDRIVDSEGKLRIQKKAGASISIIGDFSTIEPVFESGDFQQVLQIGEMQVLISSDTDYQNAVDRFDVNFSDDVTSLDALQIINELSVTPAGELPLIESLDDFGGRFFDVSGDNELTALDALQVINEVARRQTTAEAESIDDAMTLIGAQDRHSHFSQDEDRWWIHNDHQRGIF